MNYKKIVSGTILKDKMREAINLLCDTVKFTLGPKGCNVIIDSSNYSPFITNDGVTIAENIGSDDEVVNTILELAKEASVVTNKNVGDGTTTTLVILQSLFNLSMDLIDNGENLIKVKKQLNDCLDDILKFSYKEKISINNKLIYNIANIACNDSLMAGVVSEVFSNISFKEAISIKEIEEPLIRVKYFSGYNFQCILPSVLFLKDKITLNYKDSCVLILDDVLSDLENISVILNDFFDTSKSLVIIANDFSSNVVNEILSYVLNGELNCLLVKINDYGMRLRFVEKDLEAISGAKIVNSERDVSVNSLGLFKNVFVTKDNFRVDFSINNSIKKYVLDIEKELLSVSDDYLKEFYFNRLSMFDKGTAQIEIGAFTKTELREKRMRLDDALCAVYSSSEGVLIGGGVTLLKVSSFLNNESKVNSIWKKSLEIPFLQLMWNSGLNYEDIKSKLGNDKYKFVYNVNDNSFENVNDTYVVDSYKVVVNSLVNACSIASMLITTNSLVINEQLNNLNKVSDYGDI